MPQCLPAALAPPGWTLTGALAAVERLCLESIAPSALAESSLTCGAAAAATDHLASGGRRIRARLALDTAERLGMSLNDAVAIAAACDLLHNASLVHDDLQDRDPLRRDRATVWKRFGDDVAICTGDLLLSAAYSALARFSQPALLPAMLLLMHQRTAEAIRGQCADRQQRIRYLDDIDLYEQIVIGKSGALLSLPLELAMIGSGHAHDAAMARRAAEHFAVGYQIVDDLGDREKDAGDSGPPALNAFLVLVAADADTDPEARGIALARRHLLHAKELAQHLPEGAGALLSQLAGELCERLCEPL